MARPYIQYSIAQLESLVEEQSLNRSTLINVWNELLHRSTGRSRSLAKKVDELLEVNDEVAEGELPSKVNGNNASSDYWIEIASKDNAEGSAARSVDQKQEEVVYAEVSARQLVTAGPGTGKTDVAARRLLHLIEEGIPPGEILVLSFSRSAVKTLMRRIEQISSTHSSVAEDLRHLTVRTFDSWAFRILRLAGADPNSLLSRRYDENISAVTDLLNSSRAGEVRGAIGQRKHILVDEFQDLPGVRGAMVLSLLASLAPPDGSGAGFTILGDPAQSIYRFALAARSGELPELDGEECWDELKRLYDAELECVTLVNNYRARDSLDLLMSRIREIIQSDKSPEDRRNLVKKELEQLPEISLADLSDASETSNGTTAILTRTNGEAIRVMQAILGNDEAAPGKDVSLRIVGQIAPLPAWIACLLGRVKAQSISRTQFQRIFATITSQIDEESRDELGFPDEDAGWLRLSHAAGSDGQGSMAMADLIDRLAWPDALPDDSVDLDNQVVITTIHQSKGMEFDRVALLEKTEAYVEQSDRALDEQACVWFVGASRASQSLGIAPPAEIYSPPRRKSFRSSVSRHVWKNYNRPKKWCNLEMGLPGDIDPCSFVDEDFLGSAEAVADLQKYLSASCAFLKNHKVMLKKVNVGGKAVRYNIHLQEEGKLGRLLGGMTDQLTKDLLDYLWEDGFQLPSLIFNLRIGEVCTLTSRGAGQRNLADPWNVSGIWMGLTLFGTGDFRMYKRGS